MPRVYSEYMDGLIALQTKFHVLDKGYVQVMDYMGDWRTVANVARTSYQGEEKQTTEEADERLIRRLMRDDHTSPFESLELRIKIAAPIFVFRQLVRHRTANWNEWSGRYSEMPDIMYVPDHERIAVQHATNKQGSGDKISLNEAMLIRNKIIKANVNSYTEYQSLLEDDLTRELSRGVLNVNLYSVVSFKMDLHNLLKMLFLRDDEHAQFEIREYAKVIATIVENWCPPIYQAYLDYRKNAWKLSAIEVDALVSNVTFITVTNALTKLADNPKYTASEYNAFIDKIKPFYDGYTENLIKVAKEIWVEAHSK